MGELRLGWAALALAIGCGGGSTTPDATPDNFDRAAMLAHVGAQVLLPMQETFEARAAAVPAAIEAYCDALDAGAPGATLAAAQLAWSDAVDAWQAADAVLVGPAVMDQRTLRERIYAWPLVATCGIDRDTATSFADPASYDVSTKLPNVRTLASIEYLLHAPADHTCPLTPPGWDQLGANLPRARCRQAHKIALDVAVQAATLRAAWRADGGDFVGELARAGQSGSSIPSAQEGVNLVSDGMFYVDKMVKDMKLAEAAGLAVNSCGTVQAPCAREVELAFSDRSSFAIRANLIALRAAFTGKTATADGPSFDDFLRALGQPEVADRMIGKLDDAIAKANALPNRFLAALSTDRDGNATIDVADYPEIVAAHAAIKAFTDDLKSQFLTVLSLEIPDDVATDND